MIYLNIAIVINNNYDYSKYMFDIVLGSSGLTNNIKISEFDDKEFLCDKIIIPKNASNNNRAYMNDNTVTHTKPRYHNVRNNINTDKKVNSVYTRETNIYSHKYKQNKQRNIKNSLD